MTTYQWDSDGVKDLTLKTKARPRTWPSSPRRDQGLDPQDQGETKDFAFKTNTFQINWKLNS